jgi:cytochrome c oxidase assembly protein subunit 15
VTDQSPHEAGIIAPWHRNLLVAAVIFVVMLIAMGGILCMTQFIRTCPDWPGCFGKLVPPAEIGPILEYSHRLLAAVSGLLILGAAIVGLVQKPRLRWIVIPPWVSVLLLLEVSYFGAQVVLHGLSPGWAAVDVGSALMVVALMVASMIFALEIKKSHGSVPRFSFNTNLGKLATSVVILVYLVLLSGVLVTGKNSISGCLAWPVYSLHLYQIDLHAVLKTIRLIVSVFSILLLVALLVEVWRERLLNPAIQQLAHWVGIFFFIEALLQVLILIFSFPISLLIGYTIATAVLWAFLVALWAKIGLETRKK